MKKALTVLLWLALAASLTMLFAENGQKNALLRDENSALRRNERMQAQYDEAREQLEEAVEAGKTLAEEKAALTQENAALKEQLKAFSTALQAVRAEADALARSERAANEALAAARQDREEQVNALTAEKDAAADKPAEAQAVLSPGVPETDAPPLLTAENLFACPETGPDAPETPAGPPVKNQEAAGDFRFLEFKEAFEEQPVLPYTKN